MSVTSQNNRVSYAGNDVTTEFSYPYLFQADADLVVISVNDTTLVETVKTLTTHYTVAGEGEASGGTVTMLTAPATGTTLVIYAKPAVTQTLDLAENDNFPSASVETALDRNALISRFINDIVVNRTMRFKDGYTGSFDPKFPADIDDAADKVPLVNAGGTGWADVADWPTADDLENAEENATAAAASATAAATSATNAATSATNAATSATNAATSATAAATSETNAAASAASAASAVATALTSIPNGSAATPSLAFASDTNTGIYRVGADIIGITCGGTDKITIDGPNKLLTFESGFAATGLTSLTSALTIDADTQNTLTIARYTNAGDGTSAVHVRVGNSGANQGIAFLGYTNAAAAGAPVTILGHQPRNNGNTTVIDAAQIKMYKVAASDAGEMELYTATSGGTLTLGLSIDSTQIVTCPKGVRTRKYITDVSNPPTDAELDSAIGTPANMGSGFMAILDDNGAHTNEYLVWTDGTTWFYVAGTLAV